MALFGWGVTPVYWLTNLLVSPINLVLILVVPKFFNVNAATISSNEVLPALSPMPFIVTST